MIKYILLFLLVLISTNFSLQQDDTCPVSISHGKLQDQIIQYGKILEKWEITPYIATPDTDIEYFHTLRILSNETNSPPIVIFSLILGIFGLIL